MGNIVSHIHQQVYPIKITYYVHFIYCCHCWLRTFYHVLHFETKPMMFREIEKNPFTMAISLSRVIQNLTQEIYIWYWFYLCISPGLGSFFLLKTLFWKLKKKKYLQLCFLWIMQSLCNFQLKYRYWYKYEP